MDQRGQYMGSPRSSLSAPLDETMVRGLWSHHATTRGCDPGRRTTEELRQSGRDLPLLSPVPLLGAHRHISSCGHGFAFAVELQVHHGMAHVPGGGAHWLP